MGRGWWDPMQNFVENTVQFHSEGGSELGKSLFFFWGGGLSFPVFDGNLPPKGEGFWHTFRQTRRRQSTRRTGKETLKMARENLYKNTDRCSRHTHTGAESPKRAATCLFHNQLNWVSYFQLGWAGVGCSNYISSGLERSKGSPTPHKKEHHTKNGCKLEILNKTTSREENSSPDSTQPTLTKCTPADGT